MDLPEPATELSEEKRDLQRLLSRPYKYGFKTMIESDVFPKGLDEDVVRAISAKKQEPEWLLDFRLRAWRRWLAMEEPTWSDNDYPAIDYQAYSYYSAPRQKEKKGSLEEVDPELLATFDKLGIPLAEQKRLANVAVDAVFDSVSIATTFREELAKAGVVFCSISEAVREFPDLVRQHLGSVVSEREKGEEREREGALGSILSKKCCMIVPVQRGPCRVLCAINHRPLSSPLLPNPPFPGPEQRQLLCGPELGGVFGRVVCVRAARRAVPHGAEHLLPHQRRGDGAV